MDPDLLDKKRLTDWISQFDNEDKHMANSLIREITYINQYDYDKYTDSLAKKITKEAREYDAVYLLPITKTSVKTVSNNKQLPKSDGDFSYNIKKKIRIEKDKENWSLPEERNNLKRNSLIIILDEYIGSGGSVSSAIDSIEYIDRIKSLVSFKKVTIKTCSIVSYKQSRISLAKLHGYLDDPLYEVDGLSFSIKKYKKFFEKYAKNKNFKKCLYGFNKGKFRPVCGSIVIYNSCPNNTPAILWCRQKGEPTPIFSEKKVPLKYINEYYFHRKKIRYISMILWKDEKTRLNTIKKHSYYIYVELILLLYKTSSEITYKSYSVWSGLPQKRTNEIIEFGKEIGYLKGSKTIKLTALGEEISLSINNLYDEIYQKAKYKTITPINTLEDTDYLLYYPTQIKGVKALV